MNAVEPDPSLADRIRSALALSDTGAQAYLRFGARLDTVSAVHAQPGAVAWRSIHAAWDRPWIIAMGQDPDRVADSVLALIEDGDLPEGLTVAREAFTRLPAQVRPVEHWEWDWWFTTRPPAVRPGEERVRALDADDPLIPALLQVASPDAMVRPGDPRIRGWWGITADSVDPHEQDAPDDLVAVAAVTTMRPGIPHLGSVATHPDWRGRGLSRDLCARLTRDALAEGPEAVTLGMHAANRSARAVYSSLGSSVGQRWASGRISPGIG